MKTTRSSVVLLLLLVVAAPARAQHEGVRMQGAPPDTSGRAALRGALPRGLASGVTSTTDPMDVLHTGRMQEAMQKPLQRSLVFVYGLPTFAVPLDLTGDQVADLQEKRDTYFVMVRLLQNRAAWAGQQLDAELALPSPAPARVRTLLRELASQQAEVKALAFASAAGMLDMLTPAQHQALAGLDPARVHHHLAAHLTADEMWAALDGTDEKAPPRTPNVLK